MAIARFLGVDLAWGEARPGRSANETGVVALDARGQVLAAGWTQGVESTLSWVIDNSGSGAALLFVDAPLMITNLAGQRLCEKQVGQRYGRWKVSANSTNLRSPRQAGVALRHMLEARGWCYSDGTAGPPNHGRTLSECYPYTTLVGAAELGYHTERPPYKRKPRGTPSTRWRAERAATCDDLIRRLEDLDHADPPLLLRSHPVTRRLTEEPSPHENAPYKHREDLIDALLSAWTAGVWGRFGKARCQVLGLPSADGVGPAATIIAPARPEQMKP